MYGSIKDSHYWRIIVCTDINSVILYGNVSTDCMSSKSLSDKPLLYRPWQSAAVACEISGKFGSCWCIRQHLGITFADHRFLDLNFFHGLPRTLSFQGQGSLTRFF